MDNPQRLIIEHPSPHPAHEFSFQAHLPTKKVGTLHWKGILGGRPANINSVGEYRLKVDSSACKLRLECSDVECQYV